MRGADELLAVIEAIHAAGLDAELWPQALAGIARIVGAAAATIEVFDKRSLAPRELYAWGIPPAAEIKYLDHYGALNPRLPAVARARLGELCWDYGIFDEDTIDRDPFYMEFLGGLGLRYFASGMIIASRGEFAGICVHRSPKQGHIDAAGIAMLERLVPHVRQAFDVGRRLRGAGATRQALERALDWLADGVVLVRSDGTVLYANAAFAAMAGADDGIRAGRNRIELAAPEARIRLEAALAALDRTRSPDPHPAADDFAVARPSGAPSYLVSVRPLPAEEKGRDAAARGMIFVHDPLSRNATALRALREMFGLTAAELGLAQALCTGVPLRDYARARAVSRNTVYTHLRRIKEKTGCSRLTELIHKLDDLHVPLRGTEPAKAPQSLTLRRAARS